MGKSSQDHSIGTMKGNSKLETGLVHDMIGVGRQCRLKGESQCKDRAWARTGESLCSKQHKVPLKVEGQVPPGTKESLIGAMFKDSKYSCKFSELPIIFLMMNDNLAFSMFHDKLMK